MGGDVVFDDEYEAAAWRAIQEWEKRGNSSMGSALRLVGKPAEFVTNALFRLPVAERGAERLSEGMQEAVRRLGHSVSSEKVRNAVSELNGVPVSSLDGLRSVSLHHLDAAAKGLDRKYIALGSATGGASGALASIPGVGTPLALGALAADVLSSTTSLLGAVAQYGTHYGRDVTTPEESHFAVGLLSLGAVARDAQSRQALLTELHSVSLLLARGATWAELSKHASVNALQATFERLGPQLTKRKLAQTLPLVGAVVGGTAGAALADATCQAAILQYRRRYLLDKYPRLAGQHPASHTD